MALWYGLLDAYTLLLLRPKMFLTNCFFLFQRFCFALIKFLTSDTVLFFRLFGKL